MDIMHSGTSDGGLSEIGTSTYHNININSSHHRRVAACTSSWLKLIYIVTKATIHVIPIIVSLFGGSILHNSA